MSVIQIENLKYRYPGADKLALDGVSLNVEKGDFVGIVGANGAGKSTLTQAIIGLVPQFYKGAYGGSVTLNLSSGKTITAAKSPVSDNSESVGLIFQNPFNQLSGAKDTVYDEVAFGLMNLAVDKEEMRRRIEKVLKQLDIWRYKDRNPFDLSGGQMQRVAIASILVMEPEIIILDEPTSQLDPQGTEEVFKAIDALAKMGMTIILVEQKLELIAKYCNKVLLMHEGKAIDYNCPNAIFSREDLYELGIEPPAYTRLCKKYGVKNKDGDYPSTIDETKELFIENKIAIDSQTEKTDGAINSDVVFDVENLDFSYIEGTKIFDGLDVSIRRCPTAIVGQNGAGKTTLVRLLKGLIRPSNGQIMLGDMDILDKTVASLAKRVGYVFQNPDDQIFKNKVIDEIMFGPINIGMDEKTARDKSKWAMELLGLTGKENMNPYDLELHERKMVAIASVVAMDTDVIILDEPTIAQDYKGRQLIAGVIKRLSDEGKLVIAILHDMDFVMDNFEHVIAMAHGKILMEGSASKVFSHEDVLQEAKLKKPYILSLIDELK